MHVDSNAPLCGVYRGVCKNSGDPEGRGRLQLSIPQIYGPDVVLPYWAWPCVPASGLTRLPSVGQGVWVMFEAGDADRPVWMGTYS